MGFQPEKKIKFPKEINGKYLTELVFGLKARNILAQWKRPERTTPWVKMNK